MTPQIHLVMENSNNLNQVVACDTIEQEVTPAATTSGNVKGVQTFFNFVAFL